MNIPCALSNKACIPCIDFPVSNLSAEDPDVDVFIGFSDLRVPLPPGTLFAQIGCKRICYSEVSQDEANDCALLQAQECVWDDAEPPQDPPNPPEPDPEGGGTGTPGGVPPASPRNPLTTYRNTRQCCTVECSNGAPFEKCQAAGTVGDLSQAVANAKARSLACKRANAEKLCFVNLPASGCVGEGYESQLLVVGGTPFDNGTGYIWNAVGNLPPGLFIDGFTGVIYGTPLISGSFLFEVDVFDAADNFASAVFTICIGEITTDTELPAGAINAGYSQALAFDPADVTDETWELTAGTLPDGITLSAAGVLSGTPTAAGSYIFTITTTGTCFEQVITCQKSFTLEISACSLSCLRGGNVALSTPMGAQWSAYADNAGLIFGGTSDGVDPSLLVAINPDTEAVVGSIAFGALEGTEAGVYDPYTERLIVSNNVAGGIDLLVINPLTIAVEDTIAASAGGISKLALDELNHRVYLSTNAGPCACYSFDVVTHLVTLISTGSTTLGALAYSPDDNEIFFAGDANSIRVLDAASFGLVTTIAVLGGNVTSLAYCPTNRCLYGAVFNLSLVRVWNLADAIATNTTLDFVNPSTGGDVAVQFGTTTGFVQGRTIIVDGETYTVTSIDSAVQATIRNVTAQAGLTVTAPATVSTEGIAFLTDIAMGSNSSGLVYDAQFDHLISGHFAAANVQLIDPGMQAIDCIIAMTLQPSFTTVGNSGCKAFIPLDSVYGIIS